VKTTYTDHSTVINTQTIEVRNPPPDDPCKRQRHIVASDIPFQGEGEAFGTTSLGVYFIYYHKDTSGNCEKLLKKPIIICDGFDPEDENKIIELENYFKYKDQNNTLIQSIDKMTSLGFDVIMLNFPVLGDSVQLEGRSDVRTSLNTTISANLRDGGSDFIERNAMLMVKLIQQVNDSLLVNGSSEQLCILGPSMGGLITKYALAFMEQQDDKSVPKMNHNTRVWCSFDSPHLGANVPIGNMVGLVQLAERANSEGAANKFRIKLSNPAAREQLVTQTALNSGETIFQNNTATLRQTFLNNINTNGLTGSDGWPVNLKRIALSNASDNGVENGIPGDEIMHIKANKLGKKVFEFQTKFMGRTNESVDITDIFFTTKWFIFLWPHNPDPVSLLNSNPNGAMENLPGSYLGSNQDVFDGILEELKNEKTNIKIQYCKPNHTFMPVISTLAFNNTNVDWSQVLNNRNLVCTGEIPFDAYFIDGRNNPHITITEANYNWLEYQFLNGVSGCDPVCGAFTITGDQQICDGNTNTVHTYTFNGGIDAGETLTWSVSGDLVINSSSGNTAGIKITAANGSGIVTATLKNACGDRVVQNFQVQVGKPNIYLTSALNEDECKFLVTINTTPTGKIPLSYQWSTNGVSYTNGAVSKEFWLPPHHTSMWVYARADWGCGYTADDILLEFPENSNCDDIWPLPPLSNSDANSSGKFLLTPNPTLSGWNLTIPQDLKENIYISLFDMNNRLIYKYKVENISNKIFIEGENLTPGLYIINISSQKNNFTIKAMKL